MATLRQSKQVAAFKYATAPTDGDDLTPIIGDFVVPSTLALNDVIEMGILPAECVPVDLILTAEDIDTGATLTLNAGLISGTAGLVDNTRTCGADFLSASTVGQTGGVARMDQKAGGLITATTADRGWGLKVAAAAAGVTAGAKIRAVLYVAPKTVTM